MKKKKYEKAKKTEKKPKYIKIWSFFWCICLLMGFAVTRLMSLRIKFSLSTHCIVYIHFIYKLMMFSIKYNNNNGYIRHGQYKMYTSNEDYTTRSIQHE